MRDPDSTSRSFGPLSGFTVLELATYAAGPSAGAILADWGARVLKVEPPGGDPFRRLANANPAVQGDYTSADQDNRGKRSVVIDLTQSTGRTVLEELIARTDVFLTNLRAPALKKLTLDYETLGPRHPRLVYAWITGHGERGEDADLPAFDVGTWWGRAGVALQVLGNEADPLFHAGGIGDHATGMALAGGICAALLARARTGEGQRVLGSLLRGGASFIGSDIYAHLCGTGNPHYTPRETRPNPLVLPYRSKDRKWMMLLGVEPDRVWSALARAIERPELADHPDYAKSAARNARRLEVVRLLDAAFATRIRDEWAVIFRREGVWWAPMQSVPELRGDRQMQEAGCFVKVPTRWGEREMVPAPIDFSATPWSIRHGSPAVGEHSDEVLRELGRSDAEIARLRDQGVIR